MARLDVVVADEPLGGRPRQGGALAHALAPGPAADPDGLARISGGERDDVGAAALPGSRLPREPGTSDGERRRHRAAG